jgi:hypothetical protein
MSGGGPIAQVTSQVAPQQSSGQIYGGMPIGNAHAPQGNPFTQEVKYPQLNPMPFMGQQPQQQQNPFGGQVAPAQPNQTMIGGLGGQNQGMDVIVHGQPYQQQNGQGGIASLVAQPYAGPNQMTGNFNNNPTYVPGQGYMNADGTPHMFA